MRKLFQYLGCRHPSNAFLILTFYYEMSWIRTNDGLPTDLQSVALTTQPSSRKVYYDCKSVILGFILNYLH